jgi:hypothetical protein
MGLRYATLFIPTRDSGRWIGIFLDDYRARGIEPFYFVDSRTTDDTAEILRQKNARFQLCTPTGDFAEAGMLSFAHSQIDTPWSLRLDDDEFPSAKLLQSIDAMCVVDMADAWRLPRREVSLVDGRFVYSKFPTRYQYFLSGPLVERALTPQPRLLRNSGLKFVEKVHTPGVIVPTAAMLAGDDCFFVHCKNFLLSPSERLAKVKKYASFDEEKAWSAVDEYVPELFSSELFDFSDDGLEEFTSLFERLPKAREIDFKLTEADRSLAVHHTLKALVTHLSEREKQVTMQNRDLALIRDFSPLLSGPLCKRASEVLMTLGRVLRSEKIVKLGKNLYRVGEILTEEFR